MKLVCKDLLVGTLAVLIGFAGTAGSAVAQQEQSSPDLSAELAEARERLAEAAREVARLSAELSGPFVQDLQRWFGGDRRAMLGINIDNADRGVLVTGVSPGGPAAEAGLQTGDVVVAIDGAELASGGDRTPAQLLQAHMGHVNPGESVELRVLRGEEPRTVTVQAAPYTRSFAWEGQGPWVDVEPRGPRIVMPFPRGRSVWRGLELIPVTSGLGAYFGTEQGLLVVRAPENNELGLRDGDVILDISGRTPTSPEHAMRILASFEPGETMRLSIMRQQGRQTLDVAIPERPARRSPTQ